MSNTIPLNQWSSGRYIMAEDGATISVDGHTMVTPNDTLSFQHAESVKVAAYLYIAGRRREWEAKWLVGGWKRISGFSTLIKVGTPYSIHVRGSCVVVCRGTDEYLHPTFSAALESVNSGRYEKVTINFKGDDQKPRPARLEVGQVWRREGTTTLVDFIYEGMRNCSGMSLGENLRILDYADAEYVGKVTIG